VAQTWGRVFGFLSNLLLSKQLQRSLRTEDMQSRIQDLAKTEMEILRTTDFDDGTKMWVAHTFVNELIQGCNCDCYYSTNGGRETDTNTN
jgi:hypothetical protein